MTLIMSLYQIQSDGGNELKRDIHVLGLDHMETICNKKILKHPYTSMKFTS
jgi:hypothetical protein